MRWVFTFADFLAALIIVFLVLHVVSIKHETWEAAAEYFSAPYGITAPPAHISPER